MSSLNWRSERSDRKSALQLAELVGVRVAVMVAANPGAGADEANQR